MEEIIVLRYGEIYLKGKNRSFFENQLIRNIKFKLKDFSCKLIFNRSRYEVCEFKAEDKGKIIYNLSQVFGLHSISPAYKTSTDIEDITSAARLFMNKEKSFRIKAHRGDKRYPLTSIQIGQKVGEKLLSDYDYKVDLYNPEITVNVDIRENGCAYVFGDVIKCAGGMPVGTAGEGISLLSGGIDSPVAAYMMLKRGLRVTALHFHSYPYTSELAKQKVITLAKKLVEFGSAPRLICISTTAIQEAIHTHCEDSYMITLLRRAMMRLAVAVASEEGVGCIVNGESLAQVASQTLQGITTSNAVVNNFPVLRPLIGMDKDEIIQIAKNIDTYETSVLPYEDCCTVFLPQSPATKPTVMRAEKEESKIPDYDALIRNALETKEIINLK